MFLTRFAGSASELKLPQISSRVGEARQSNHSAVHWTTCLQIQKRIAQRSKDVLGIDSPNPKKWQAG